jgi:hypothetical protein
MVLCYVNIALVHPARMSGRGIKFFKGRENIRAGGKALTHSFDTSSLRRRPVREITMPHGGTLVCALESSKCVWKNGREKGIPEPGRGVIT